MNWTRKILALAPLALTLAAHASEPATLSIEYVGVSGPFVPGDLVQVQVRMTHVPVTSPAAGFQAFLNFDTTRLSFVSGAYTSSPFGQHIIVPIANASGDIDMASGIDVFIGQQPTSADSTLALLTFEVETECGVGEIQFRTHKPPTRLSTLGGDSILPLALVDLEPLVTCPADQFQDDVVDVDDLLVVITNWGDCPISQPCCPGDIDNTGQVDVDDLLLVIVNWGPCP